MNQFNDVAKTSIEEWMDYLKSGVIHDDTQVPGLQEAREKLNYMKMTREERHAYEDYMVSVHAARDVYQTAIAEGRAKGRAEGLEEGERLKAIEIARVLKSKGMQLADIIGISGLTEKDLGDL